MNGRRILIPVNLPRGPFDTLPFAQRLATEIPICVTLLNVVTLNVVPLDRRIYAEACAQSQIALQNLASLYFDGGTAVRIRIRVGRPHEEIVAEAQTELTELIVLPTPKPSRWSGLFGWGTIERVAGDAPCPTLVLPRAWKMAPERFRRGRPLATESSGTVAGGRSRF